jgi:NAD-dependent dihydropyrimidine dehydrogenase PreA subunit
MRNLRYLESAVTLAFDAEKCTGCRTCTLVCPHGVWAMDGARAVLADKGACMECGACALNCSAGAISVDPGVGCASAIITGWLTGSEPTCGCSDAPGSATGTSCCGGSAPAEADAESGCGCGGECGDENTRPRRGSSCC